MKIIASGLVMLLVLNAYGLPVPTDPGPDPGPAVAGNSLLADKAKAEVQRRGAGEKSHVKVRLRDKTQLKGYISRIDTDSFQLREEKTGKELTIAYDSVENIHGRGLSTGAKVAIGIGVGAAIGVAVMLALVISFHGN
jgi:hypothetical protein